MATTDGAIEDITTGTSDGDMRGLNCSCVVVVSCYATESSGDFMCKVVSELTRTACRQKT